MRDHVPDEVKARIEEAIAMRLQPGALEAVEVWPSRNMYEEPVLRIRARLRDDEQRPRGASGTEIDLAVMAALSAIGEERYPLIEIVTPTDLAEFAARRAQG